jgi:branched-chain amino acid transport system permease protein
MVGSIYSLVGLGFVLIYKSTRIFNIAQGDLLTFGAYICFAFLVQLDLPLWAGILITFVVAALLGLVLERIFLRPLIGQPIIAAIMMTIALGLLIKAVVLFGWLGPTRVYPEFIPAAPLRMGDIILSQQHLYSFLVAILLFVILTLFFRHTKAGLAMRAVGEDHQVAQAAGVRVRSVFSQVWMVASVVAAVGGVLLGSINGISPELGILGLKAFPVVVLGGLDSIPGVIIAGPIVGMLEHLAIGYLDPLPFVGGGMADVAPYIILLLILLIKPYGLMGLKRIERI